MFVPGLRTLCPGGEDLGFVVCHELAACLAPAQGRAVWAVLWQCRLAELSLSWPVGLLRPCLGLTPAPRPACLFTAKHTGRHTRAGPWR